MAAGAELFKDRPAERKEKEAAKPETPPSPGAADPPVERGAQGQEGQPTGPRPPTEVGTERPTESQPSPESEPPAEPEKTSPAELPAAPAIPREETPDARTGAPPPAPVALPPPAGADTPATPVPPWLPPSLPRSLGSTFGRQFLLDLPGQGLWSLFETVESTAIVDRMESGGMYVGEAPLLGIRGSSWTQVSWTLGDLDVTDPDRTGTPLFFVDADQIDAVEIAAGLSPAQNRGVGADISMSLRRPQPTWRRKLQMNQVPSLFRQSRGAGISRLDSFASGRFLLEGPLLKDRLALLVTANLQSGGRRERSDPRTLKGEEQGLLAHVVYTPSSSDEFRFATGLQGASHPYGGRARFGGGDVRQTDRFFLLQSTWERRGARPFSLSAGLVHGSFDPRLPGGRDGVIDRTDDGPVQLLFPGTSSRRRLALSGHWDPVSSSLHALRVGGSLASLRSTTRPAGQPGFLTAETVAGLPARVWDYGWGGPVSRWSGLDFSAYATDQLRYGRLLLDGGLRYDLSRGSAEGSRGQISWSGLSPRIVARVRPFAGPGLALLAGYARYMNRLPLNLLAYGDPTAPQGRVYRWRDDNGDGRFEPEERGELVSRVGPGGDVATIDPALRAPRSRDVFVGLEGRKGAWEFRFLAYHRRESSLVTSVNVGAPPSAYDVYYVPDPGNDIHGTTREQMLPIYNRRPATFGQDRYVLTNDLEKARGKGLEVLLERGLGKRFRLLLGATASKSVGPAAYRGFDATQNDQGVVGERLELPNASTLSKGRLFFERGYNLKIAATYVAPHDLRLGAVARYQDGQHFARLVVPTDLNQGPEPVRGITNGESRFTFVLTFDARVEKSFSMGPRRLAAVLEAFNLGGSSIEVEEHVIWGPYYRATSAVQPPRTVRLGLQLDF